MAKHRQCPVTAKDLAEYLAERDDFRLELAAYGTARSLGLCATHGGTYEDPVTKKPRQYDVRAWMLRGIRRIELAIECKSLQPSFPLLISRIPRISEESFHHVVRSRHRATDSYLQTGITPPADTLVVRRGQPFYRPGELVGKSTVQVGRNEKGALVTGDGDVYEKWAQALGSAADRIQKAAYYEKESASQEMFTVVIPVLVVANETLWVADYSDTGRLQHGPRLAEDALLFVGRDYWQPLGISYTVSHLHVYTEAGFVRFLESIAGDDGLWDAMLPPLDVLDVAAEA